MSHIHCLIYMLIWKFEQSIAILFRILYTLTSPVCNRLLVGTAEPRFTIRIAGTSDHWNRGFAIFPFRLPAQTSPLPFSPPASAPSHPCQTVCTPAACPLSATQRGQAFFLTKSCQDSLNSCSDSPTFNDLNVDNGWGGCPVSRIDYRLV